MKKLICVLALCLTLLTTNAYAGGCGVRVNRAVSYNNGFAYNNNAVVVQTVVPAVVLPVLASHGNFVTAQPFVLDQTFAQINTGVYGSYGIVNTVVPQVNITALNTNQNTGIGNGGLLQRASNAVANRGRTTVVQNADKSQTIIRQRLIGGTTVETVK